MSVSPYWTRGSTSSLSTISPIATKPLSNGYNPSAGGCSSSADIRNEEAIYEILRAYEVTAVIHLAGLKAVGDFNVRPLTYYENNVSGTMRLVSAMKMAKLKTLVFISSATVYGVPRYLPLDEKHPLRPTNPYGRTKFGNDYDTPDGTGIRDFIHVVDLASGHLSALSHLKQPRGVHGQSWNRRRQ
jgi:UDP-glucose 4-epimerase